MSNVCLCEKSAWSLQVTAGTRKWTSCTFLRNLHSDVQNTVELMVCNMKKLACLLVFSVLPDSHSCLAPKENHTENSISYKDDWPIRSGYLLILMTYFNPLFWYMLAMWLSTFFSGAAHILLLQWSGQEWEESTSSFPEFSCSHCTISSSYLVFPPILPAWPISIYLKHDWQDTDNSSVQMVELKNQSSPPTRDKLLVLLAC